MARKTLIEWATATWNPWYGCTKLSPACDNCYAEVWAKRTGRDFAKLTRSTTRFRDPLNWKEPERIFVCSLSDFFHHDADPYRAEAIEVMRHAPHHKYLLLSKRLNRWFMMGDGRVPSFRCPPNWWVGTTAENQEWADRRIPELLNVPGGREVIRFLSCEPLLGPIDLSDWLLVEPPINWVIVGGESGKNFRQMDPVWVTNIRDQCVAAGVPFFFKQWAASRPRDVPRLLHGREWNEIPEVRHGDS